MRTLPVARLEEGAMEGILRESKEAPSLSESLLPLARSLAPGKDVNHASSIDTVVLPHAEGGELRKFSLCATPTRVSRHNSPANPHAITEYIRGMASSRKKKRALEGHSSPQLACSLPSLACLAKKLTSAKNKARKSATFFTSPQYLSPLCGFTPQVGS